MKVRFQASAILIRLSGLDGERAPLPHHPPQDHMVDRCVIAASSALEQHSIVHMRPRRTRVLPLEKAYPVHWYMANLLAYPQALPQTGSVHLLTSNYHTTFSYIWQPLNYARCALISLSSGTLTSCVSAAICSADRMPIPASGCNVYNVICVGWSGKSTPYWCRSTSK